jgi:cyclopropane-fatty-acyl-phospholipid synthase
MRIDTANPHATTQRASIPAAARTVFALLRQLQVGSLTVQLPDGSVQRFGHQASPHGTLLLRNWNPFAAALKSGDIEIGRAHV